MKKLLGIVVLGLLLSTKAYADGSNLRKTLLNSGLILIFIESNNDYSHHEIKFKADGTAIWKAENNSFNII